MRVSHITSNPKAKVLYERLDILQTIEAALLRGNPHGHVDIVAEELGRSNIPFNEFLEHLDGLQSQGVATFKLAAHNSHDPWSSTIAISNINSRILRRQLLKAQKQLRKLTGRTDFGATNGRLPSALFGALGSINRAIVGVSTFLVAVGGIISWKYWHDILQILKHL